MYLFWMIGIFADIIAYDHVAVGVGCKSVLLVVYFGINPVIRIASSDKITCGYCKTAFSGWCDALVFWMMDDFMWGCLDGYSFATRSKTPMLLSGEQSSTKMYSISVIVCPNRERRQRSKYFSALYTATITLILYFIIFAYRWLLCFVMVCQS